MTTIPEKYVDLGRELAALAAKYDLQSLSGSFQPAYSPKDDAAKWNHKISFVWETGRHGDAMREILLTSEVRLRTTTLRDGTFKTDEW